MGIAFVQEKGGGFSAGPVTITFGSATTTGDLIVAGVLAYDPGASNDATAASSVTDNYSNTYTRITGLQHPTNIFYRLDLYYAKNISGGASHQVTASNGISPDLAVIALEYSGADPSSPLDQSVINSAVSSNPDPGSITAANGYLVVGIAGENNPNSSSAGTGFTLRSDPAASSGAMASEDAISTGSALDAKFTSANSTWVAAAASFRPVGAAVNSGAILLAQMRFARPIPSHRGPRRRFPHSSRLILPWE